MKVQKLLETIQVVTVDQLVMPEVEEKTLRVLPFRLELTGIIMVMALLKVRGVLGIPYWRAEARVLPVGRLVTVLVALVVVRAVRSMVPPFVGVITVAVGTETEAVPSPTMTVTAKGT